MASYRLKYADARGEVRQQVLEAPSEDELRERLVQQGYLVYSIRPAAGVGTSSGRRKGKINVEKFLIFNQQFVTLFRAGLPILKALDLLADRLTDKKLGPYISAIRDDVKKGSLLSEAFERQGVFPAIYVTSVMAGEKSGALGDVLERYVTYQKLALAVRKKLLVSLIYPSVLFTLVVGLVIFLITFVVPRFATLYQTTTSKLPLPTRILMAVGEAASQYIGAAAIVVAVVLVGGRFFLRSTTGQRLFDRFKLKLPVLGEIWIKYQVAQISRLMSTLLAGGIPLVQGLTTASTATGSPLIRSALEQVERMVREGQPMSLALSSTGVFPPLSIDMVEVGESTGALPQMLNSVAEFYEEDVGTRLQAALALIEPAIMIFMGIFVAFVLVSLYLPIFSLAESFG
jgi:type IV pilus assembly protein PilC